MAFYFALVTEEDTTWDVAYKRNDEQVLKYEMSHSEGQFPTLTAEIKNPRHTWITGGFTPWVWFTKNDTPIFFGRMIGAPQDLQNNKIKVMFVAEPLDYYEQIVVLSDGMKVRPFWDLVWIDQMRELDPHVILETYPGLWHIDRVNLGVSYSDFINGEDGLIVMDNLFYDSLSMTFGAAPPRAARMYAQISWDQRAVGEIDVTPFLLQAFKLAGSNPPRISSLTGQGLEEDWLQVGDNLKGSWVVTEDRLLRVDGTAVTRRELEVTIQPVAQDDGNRFTAIQASLIPAYSVTFYEWEFVPTLKVGFDVSRQKIEDIEFVLEADMQPLFSNPGNANVLMMPAMQSRRVVEPIDPDGAMPIGDPSARAYLPTDRGKISFEYLLMMTRAALISKSRAVTVKAAYTFDFGLQFSCRKNLTIIDPRLPDGQATGKIIGYTLVAEGTGRQYSTVAIGCTIGRGNTVEAEEGEGDYAEDDWDEDYQYRTNSWAMPVADELTYKDYSDTPIIDDGVNFSDINVASLIKRFDVINGIDEQRDAMSGRFNDPDSAIETLNAHFTEVWMELENLQKGPYITKFTVEPSGLMIPRLVNLEDG